MNPVERKIWGRLYGLPDDEATELKEIKLKTEKTGCTNKNEPKNEMQTKQTSTVKEKLKNPPSLEFVSTKPKKIKNQNLTIEQRRMVKTNESNLQIKEKRKKPVRLEIPDFKKEHRRKKELPGDLRSIKQSLLPFKNPKLKASAKRTLNEYFEKGKQKNKEEKFRFKKTEKENKAEKDKTKIQKIKNETKQERKKIEKQDIEIRDNRKSFKEPKIEKPQIRAKSRNSKPASVSRKLETAHRKHIRTYFYNQLLGIIPSKQNRTTQHRGAFQ